MLIEFRVKNYRSLRSEQVLTMEASSDADANDIRPRKVAGNSNALLPAAAIYGANASGKTNLLSAIGFMQDAVQNSHRSWDPDESIPRDAFAWDGEKQNPSLFEVAIIIDKVRYEYGFVASDEEFLEEWLYAWPKGKRQIWFERDPETYKFGEHLKGENKLMEGFTRKNSLFLSTAVQHSHFQLQPIFRWFRNLRLINRPFGIRSRRAHPYFLSPELLSSGMDPSLFDDEDAKPNIRDQFQELLQSADLGIVDFQRVERTTEDGSTRLRVMLKHQNRDQAGWLPLSEESKGTQMLFALGPSILHSLQDGSPLIVDELEASLHPMMALQILKMFNDPVRNPKNAQLLFTTHDTNLLSSLLGAPALRRDQVWFTEKDDQRATGLYPLTDYHPRKAENLERGYLQGRYGSIPFLGNFPSKERS